MRKIAFSDVNIIFDAIAGNTDLYIPVDTEAGVARFEAWDKTKKLTSALQTVRSAKDFFFPQVEDIATFKVEGKNIQVFDNRRECPDFVLFGVRACDWRAISILDKVYLVDPVDTYYKTRKDHSIVVCLACDEPEETCFCKNFGIDPAEPAGDVSAWVKDGFLYLEGNTQKGKNLVSILEDYTEEVDPSEVDSKKEEINAIMEKLPFANLDLSRFTGENLLPIFDDERWEELAEACIACGTCTYVCPTCQCYDVREFNTGKGIERFRCWDSCMYSDFTKCAHGNPRTTQLQRMRQRFMHKLVYNQANHGEYGCVGCGRCVKKCPINMNIVKAIKTLGVEKV